MQGTELLNGQGLPWSQGVVGDFSRSCVYLAVILCNAYLGCGASQVTPVVKNPLANAGDERDAGSILGSGRGGGYGNPLQYSGLENPMDRGAWWLQLQSWKWLKWLSGHACRRMRLLAYNPQTAPQCYCCRAGPSAQASCWYFGFSQ